MRISSYSSFTLLLAGALACEGRGTPSDSDTADTGTSTTSTTSTTSSSSTADTPDPSSPSTTASPTSDPSETTSTTGTTGLPDTGTTGSPDTGSNDVTTGTTALPDTGGNDVTTGTTGLPDTEGEDATTGTTDPGEPRPCEGEPAPIDAELISYLESQIVGDGESSDETRIYVRFSSQTFTCADPHDRPACGEWELSLRIPTEFQTPGLYSLWDGDVFAYGYSNGPDKGDDWCDGGGGMAKGTFELIAIDENTVTGRLCHVESTGFDGPIVLDGSFVAPRCPQ